MLTVTKQVRVWRKRNDRKNVGDWKYADVGEGKVKKILQSLFISYGPYDMNRDCSIDMENIFFFKNICLKKYSINVHTDFPKNLMKKKRVLFWWNRTSLKALKFCDWHQELRFHPQKQNLKKFTFYEIFDFFFFLILD